MNEQTSRPTEISDEAVQALATGQVVEVGGPSRPRQVTDEDVATLGSEGGAIESFAHLASADGAELYRATARGSRPRDLSDEDVATLTAGKSLDISERPPLAAQSR